MDHNSSRSLILLTYKSKALLTYRQRDSLDDGKHTWSFIEETNNSKEPLEQVFEKKVEKEMGIKVGKVEYVSESCYHAILTDDNVNQIQREEGQLLGFFTLKELGKLMLTHTTREFVVKHGELIAAASYS